VPVPAESPLVTDLLALNESILISDLQGKFALIYLFFPVRPLGIFGTGAPARAAETPHDRTAAAASRAAPAEESAGEEAVLPARGRVAG
jgi:hypothetical protein